MVYNTCHFKLPELMSYTVFWSYPTGVVKYKSLYIIYVSAQFTELFAIWLTMVFNFCLIIDLIIMVREPFS